MAVAIKISEVMKSFKLPHDKQNSIKGGLISFIKGGKRSFEKQNVLKGVSFDIEEGEFFGIVGRNGSGKSTLLKLLAGIYTPDKGEIVVNGSLTPFIELGVGFNPELTGRENVFLNGALLGFNREEMAAMYDDIVEFAELKRFMDQKLKNYSSGMQVRLAFSIAIRVDSDILLLDEVLAVGDAAFQQKCFEYFAELKQQKKTVILVSHSMSSIERFCSRAVLLDGGEIKLIGSSRDVANAYQQLFIDDMNDATAEHKTDERELNKNTAVTTTTRVMQGSKTTKAINAFSKIKIETKIASKIDIESLNVGFNIRNTDGVIVFSDNTAHGNGTLRLSKKKRCTIELEIDNRYTNGRYSVDVIIADEAGMGDKVLCIEKNTATFSIMGITEHEHSAFHPERTYRIKKDK